MLKALRVERFEYEWMTRNQPQIIFEERNNFVIGNLAEFVQPCQELEEIEVSKELVDNRRVFVRGNCMMERRVWQAQSQGSTKTLLLSPLMLRDFNYIDRSRKLGRIEIHRV